jgi:hypothetical protein
MLALIDTRLFAVAWILAWPPGLLLELFTNGLARWEALVFGTVVWLLFVLLEAPGRST